jgi:hypothetical protein
MTATLSITQNTRKIFYNFLNSYSLDQLRTIPNGFSNHLIWNINHCIVTQQLLVYKLSDLPLLVSEDWVEKYRKGSKPTDVLDENEVILAKELLFSTVQRTEEDLKAGVFKNFNAYPTSTGFVINSLEDAMQFNNFHEGIHLGVMMQIRRFL